jgi:hypothetical protein
LFAREFALANCRGIETPQGGLALFNTRLRCYFRGMKNVTITLDEQTAARARRHAAQLGVSLSRYVGELLEKSLRESREYEHAMRRYFARKPRMLSKAGAAYPKREELHERSRIR